MTSERIFSYFPFLQSQQFSSYLFYTRKSFLTIIKNSVSKKMSKDTNALNWFEIAVKDISRAKKFYEKIFEVEMAEMEMMGMKMAMFPYDGTKGTVGGSLVQSNMH